MTDIPKSALILGLAGLIPFLWGALTVMFPSFAFWGQANLGPRFIGPYVQLFYGAVILSFMSGVLWGFATKTTGRGNGGLYPVCDPCPVGIFYDGRWANHGWCEPDRRVPGSVDAGLAFLETWPRTCMVDASAWAVDGDCRHLFPAFGVLNA